MYRYNHHQLLNLPRLRSDHMSALYVADTLRTFACAALGIFIPIYIFKLMNGSLLVFQKNGALLAVLGYFILLRTSLILFTLTAAKFIVYLKSGFRRAMLFGNFLTALHLLCLIFAVGNRYFLIPSAILGGMATPLYWLPYHLIFVEDAVHQRIGRQKSFIAILSHLASVAGPFLGGLILTFFGFNHLAAVVILLVIVSSIPLFLPPHHEKHVLPSLKELLNLLKSEGGKSAWLAFLGAGVENDVQGILWPLFLFAIVGTYLKVGVLSSLVLLLSVVALSLVGKWTDSRRRTSVLKLGGFANAFIWGLRIFIQTPPQAFFADLGGRLARNFLWIPFDVFTYRRARRDPLGFLLLREWVLNIGRLIGLLLILLLVTLGVNWVVSFSLAAIGSLLALKMGSEEVKKE